MKHVKARRLDILERLINGETQKILAHENKITRDRISQLMKAGRMLVKKFIAENIYERGYKIIDMRKDKDEWLQAIDSARNFYELK